MILKKNSMDIILLKNLNPGALIADPDLNFMKTLVSA